MAAVAEVPTVRSTTELSKNTGSVLEEAGRGCVLIRREQQKGDIALMSATLARKALTSHRYLQILTALVNYTRSLYTDKPLGPPSDFSWLREFERDDAVDFLQEFSDTLSRVIDCERSVSDLDDVVEQWRRSAMVLRDETLRKRLDDELVNINNGR